MKLNKTLFYLSILCISTALANYRHFPDRSKMFSEERQSDSFPLLRNLADGSINSHNQSSSGNQIDPVTVRLKGNTELGYYYVSLFFGSPPQKQTLIVDTGSVTTTIPCTGKYKEYLENIYAYYRMWRQLWYTPLRQTL